MKLKCSYQLICFDEHGFLKWVEDVPNLVLNPGRNLLLDIMFGATSKVSTWYIGLSTDNGSVLESYTLTGEVGTRQTVTFTRTNQTVTSTDATFTGISATLRKAFLATASSSGTIFSVVNLSAPRTVNNADTLKVAYNITFVT